MGHSGGLLSRGRSAQAGVLATDGREVHQVIVTGFFVLLLGKEEGRREA